MADRPRRLSRAAAAPADLQLEDWLATAALATRQIADPRPRIEALMELAMVLDCVEDKTGVNQVLGLAIAEALRCDGSLRGEMIEEVLCHCRTLERPGLARKALPKAVRAVRSMRNDYRRPYTIESLLDIARWLGAAKLAAELEAFDPGAKARLVADESKVEVIKARAHDSFDPLRRALDSWHEGGGSLRRHLDAWLERVLREPRQLGGGALMLVGLAQVVRLRDGAWARHREILMTCDELERKIEWQGLAVWELPWPQIAQVRGCAGDLDGARRLIRLQVDAIHASAARGERRRWQESAWGRVLHAHELMEDWDGMHESARVKRDSQARAYALARLGRVADVRAIFARQRSPAARCRVALAVAKGLIPSAIL